MTGFAHRGIQNPYDTILNACQGRMDDIQTRYSAHRESRNQQQKVRLLDPTFTTFALDPILVKLTDREKHPDYTDPRHCLVFWTRPPQAIKDIIKDIQSQLMDLLPTLWFMPIENLHITIMEVAHSRTASKIAQMASRMEPALANIVNYTSTHQTCLIKPLISYDASAIALSFVPGDIPGSSLKTADRTEAYTYHHLRRDLFNLCEATGVKVASRYVVPSAHLTIARFVDQKADPRVLVNGIEQLNQSLKAKFWADECAGGVKPVHWIVGEEKGLVCREGTVWYGGGISRMEGVKTIT